MEMKLTKDFSLEEMVESDTAKRMGIKNIPTSNMIEKLRDLCVHCLQPIRDYFDKPLIVTSGFRSVALNTRVKGSATSQHMRGEAADFKVLHTNLKEVFRYAQKHLDYDQLIYEFDSWIHISYNKEGNRKQTLRAYKKNGVTIYEKVNEI